MYLIEENVTEPFENGIAFVDKQIGIINKDGKSLHVRLLNNQIISIDKASKILSLNMLDENKKVIASNNPTLLMEGLDIISKSFIKLYASLRQRGLRLKKLNKDS